MVRLPPPLNRTAAAIYALYERRADDWRRPHLGASVIGHEECPRKLWNLFRWVSAPDHDGRILRLFDRGKREEEWIIDDLRSLGWDVLDCDPITGNQWTCSFLGGHFAGSCDAVVRGLEEAPKTWHLLEVKTANKRRFDALLRDGVVKAAASHYAQMQVYMHGLGLQRALYVCVCKDDDRIYAERVRYSAQVAEAALSIAAGVVSTDRPLSRVSDDPNYFECRMCSFRPACQLRQVEYLERNCRTCASATPQDDGTWHCDYWRRAIDVREQRAGCSAHLFIPDLLPWPAVDFDEVAREVVYDTGGSLVVDRDRELRNREPAR